MKSKCSLSAFLRQPLPFWQQAIAMGLAAVLLACLAGSQVASPGLSFPKIILGIGVLSIPMCLMLAPRVWPYIRRLTVTRVTPESTYKNAADVFDAFVEKDFDEIMERDLDRWRNEGGA